MEPAILGLVLDSSILVAAERAKLTKPAVIKNIRASAGDVPIVICALTVAELAHGIYRTNSPERSQTAPPVSGRTESRGAGASIIGACALELDYAIGTSNVRDFNRIPGLTVLQL